MNFTDVVTEVMGIIKRPDKLLDVRREVNSAVNQFCMDTEFTRDLLEISQPIDVTQYTQALPISGFTRFRKFSYMKQGGTKCFLNPLPRGELLKTNCDMRNKYYIAGSNVNISLSVLCSTLDLAYFQYPPLLTDAAPTFWLLDVSPFMVIDRAAGKILASIGDGDSATRHERFAVSAFLTAQKDYGISTQ